MHDPIRCDCGTTTGQRRCIEDAESFVRDAIRDGGARLSPDDFDDVLAEGLLILAGLQKAYQPGRNGLDPVSSRWGGFASKYLRLKLGDAYHRLQENHRLVAGEDGRRRWVYEEAPVSLSHVVRAAETPAGPGVDPDPADHIRALQVTDEHDTDMAETLRGALDRRWAVDRETTVKFGVLMGMGYAATECARRLRIDAKEAALCFDRIRRVAHDLSE